MVSKARRPATLKPANILPPVGGLNTIAPGLAMDETDCPFVYNLLGAENGMRSRLGYQEWVTGLLGAADNTIRTLMPYHGSVKSGANDRLFCSSSAGIYDVTNSTQVPGAKKITYGTQTGDAGYGTWWISSTASPTKFLIYCDEENGYHLYTEGTDTWALVTGAQVTGVNPNLFVAGTNFKNRNWFVQANSTIAWYLPAGSVLGAATAFDFGSKFKNGGILIGLYNWAYDGGSGPDNYLVALSSGGDIVIYAGTDPASVATFQIRGVWYSGGVPYGRRLATDYGGDMLIITSQGVLPLSKLVIGTPEIDRSLYATYKINNLFTQLTDQYRTLKGWSIRFHANDAAAIVTVPTIDGQNTNQLVMSLTTKGWSKYRDFPMITGENFNGRFYFGTSNGRICVARDYVDNVTLASGLTVFTPVDYSLVTRSDQYRSVNQKIPRQIKLTLLSQEPAPAVNAEARFMFDQTEAAAPPGVAATAANTWDNAKWDQNVWSGDFSSSERLFGATGKGAAMAIAVRGRAQARTVIAAIDVLYDEVGFL